jgi:hypothetical protein
LAIAKLIHILRGDRFTVANVKARPGAGFAPRIVCICGNVAIDYSRNRDFNL